MLTNKVLLLIPFLAFALLISLFLAYKAHRRSRLYEQFYSTLLLDPFQLELYPTLTDSPRAGSEEVTIVFFGDSRAAYWPFPAAPAHFQFINRGIEAQTSTLVAGRWPHHLAPLKPDIVVLQVGINDLRLVADFDEKQKTIVENTKANIQQIVSDSNDLGSTVILTTIFPIGQPPLDMQLGGADAKVNEAIEEVNAFLLTLASEKTVILDTASILADEQGRVRADYGADYLHINEAGYEALNQELAPLLQASR